MYSLMNGYASFAVVVATLSARLNRMPFIYTGHVGLDETGYGEKPDGSAVFLVSLIRDPMREWSGSLGSFAPDGLVGDKASSSFNEISTLSVIRVRGNVGDAVRWIGL